MANKRTTALGDAISKAGAYFLVDKPGWSEALKFPANLIALLSDLSNYLNKSSDLIDQATAESGVDNTAKSWSSLRVRQAIIAYVNTIVFQKPINFDQDSNKSTDYIKTLPGNSRLEGIDFNFKSGTPLVKVGITNGGDELVTEYTVTVDNGINTVFKNNTVDTPAYVKISGGVVDVMFIYRPNYWS